MVLMARDIPDILVRPFAAVETERLVEVMAATFAEYGMRFDPDGFDRDVREAATRYAPPGAAFFTALASGRALGFAGVDRPRDGVAEIHRVYIDPAARGLGLGRRLCEAVEAWARAQAGVLSIELWSDVRFTHAHAMYAARGYALTGQRILGDPDRSVEFGFRRDARAEAAAWAPERLPVTARSVMDMSSDADFAHRCGMVAAAILDPRSLVREGRVAAGGHVLPAPAELFPGDARATEVSALVWDAGDGATEDDRRRGAVLGFERADERRLHPAIHDVADASWPWGCPGGCR